LVSMSKVFWEEAVYIFQIGSYQLQVFQASGLCMWAAEVN
jgi:hypothetical protein